MQAKGQRYRNAAWRGLAALATFALMACGGGGGGSGSDSSGGATPSLSVVSSTPSNGSTGVGLSLSTVTVAFDKPVATTYASFSWPHLADVQAYLLLEDLTDSVPIEYFLDYNSGTNSLVFYLSDPPQANHQYRLRLIDGLTSEADVRMNGDVTILYTMGGATFGSGIFANAVIDYSPELPAGATLDQGRYIAASILGEPQGSLHTTSLGYDGTGAGGSITVAFGSAIGGTSYCITDGAGADFIIYENVFAFEDSSGPQNFTEAAYVEVSQDGVNWYRFANTHPNTGDANLAQLVGIPANYSGLTGINVGGDAFDLADVIATGTQVEGTPTTLTSGFQACYVRIVDAGVDIPDYSSDGEFADHDPSGADIDAIEVPHSVPMP